MDSSPFPRIRIRIVVTDPDLLDVLDTIQTKLFQHKIVSYKIKVKVKVTEPTVPTYAWWDLTDIHMKLREKNSKGKISIFLNLGKRDPDPRQIKKRIQIRGSSSAQKCHGFATLLNRVLSIVGIQNIIFLMRILIQLFHLNDLIKFQAPWNSRQKDRYGNCEQGLKISQAIGR